MDVLLELDNLAVRYPDGTEALRDVDLCVSAGERIALLGPNGSGKTTLLLALMGGVKHTGRIVFDQREQTPRTISEMRRRCGLTFQEADDQLFSPTLLEDVAFGPLNHGATPAEAEDAARRTLVEVGLEGLENRSGHHLSGGQKRIASLATVLSMQVSLLLLDEPGSNLDARNRRRLLEVLDERPEAMLLATHDLELARRLCRRAVVLDDGRLVWDGATETLLTDAARLDAHGLR
jgi:cobalt/nickel transport system ATP-binding protein